MARLLEKANKQVMNDITKVVSKVARDKHAQASSYIAGEGVDYV